MTSTGLTLADADLPPLYAAADQRSRTYQRRFVRGSAAQLLLLVAAAGAAKFRFRAFGADLAQVAAAGCFLTAATVRTYLLSSRLEGLWYDSRAVAESVKTLAWRYAVGGEPFPIGNGDGEPERRFIERVRDVLDTVRSRPVPMSEPAAQISVPMNALRDAPLDERRRRYVEGRLRDQLTWYGTKSAWNERRSEQWSFIQLGIEIAGAVMALMTGLGADFNFASFAATLIGAAAAWSQTKKYGRRAAAYGLAHWELSDLAAFADRPMDEATWADYVEQVEQAISREHTIWRAAPER
jgi:hypothetical protein